MDYEKDSACGIVIINLLGIVAISFVVTILSQNIFLYAGILGFFYPDSFLNSFLLTIAYFAGFSLLLIFLQSSLTHIFNPEARGKITAIFIAGIVLFIPIAISIFYQAPMIGLGYSVLILLWSIILLRLNPITAQNTRRNIKRKL